MHSLTRKFTEYIDYRGLGLVTALLVLWEVGVRIWAPRSVLMPSVSSVIGAGIELFQSGGLRQNYAASLARVSLGFSAGALVGVVLGALLALSVWADRLLGPLITALRQVPMFGIIPLIILWFGIGETSKILFVALAAFYPVVLTTTEGLRGVPASYREVATLFMLNRWQLLRRVLVPCALPAILTGLKHGLAFAWIAVIGAELFLASGFGVGNILEAGRSDLRMDVVLFGLALIGATGYLMNYAVSTLERRLLRWRPAFS
jgi:sulfonate transport system permease protein